MKKILPLLLIVLVLSSCATYKGAGSEVWYLKRMQEIEISYKNKEISSVEYLRLKNETDAIRADYVNRDSPRSSVGFQYGIFR